MAIYKYRDMKNMDSVVNNIKVKKNNNLRQSPQQFNLFRCQPGNQANGQLNRLLYRTQPVLGLVAVHASSWIISAGDIKPSDWSRGYF